MKQPITLEYPRSLSLASSVQAEIPAGRLEDIPTIGSSLTRAMRHAGVVPAGPLIQHTQLTVEGPRHFLLRQAREYPEGVAGFTSSAEQTLPQCVFARFEGEAADIGIVYSAIEVFAYEREIDLTGEFHLVFVQQVDLHVTVDVFASTPASRL